VIIPGTNLATVTDEHGEYHLGQVPAGSREIVVSSVGFGEKQLRVDVSTAAAARHDVHARDAVAIGLLAMVATGVWIWLQTKAPRWPGLLAIGAGVLCCAWFVFGVAMFGNGPRTLATHRLVGMAGVRLCATHFPTGFRAPAAGFGALLAVIHLMLGAFLSARIANLSAELADALGEL
jgi:hypothetical protein